MDKDLIFIQRVRDNLSQASDRAESMRLNGLIDGAIIVIHAVDVHKDPSKRRRRHKFVHTELYHIGECASEEFQHNMLHHTSNYHKSLLLGKQNISFGRWDQTNAGIKHIQSPLNEECDIDILIAVWGCKTDEQNTALATAVARNL